jgi:hypothetical protein
MAGHAERQAALVFHHAQRLAGVDDPGLWDEWQDRVSGETLKS